MQFSEVNPLPKSKQAARECQPEIDERAIPRAAAAAKKSESHRERDKLGPA